MLYRLLLCLLATTTPALAFAEKTVDLYAASAIVLNQTAEVRRKAAGTGLKSVIVRLSGTRDVLDHPEVKQAIRNASSYLYQFSYQSTDQTITIAGAEQPATELVMRFSPEPLAALLRANQLPLWSANRPDLLVWTAINTSKQNYVSRDSSMGVALRRAAQDRGLPVVSPVLDLEDRSALPVSRIWAIDEGRIRVAARRYQTDAVLSGRFNRERQQWSGNFIMLHQSRVHYFTATGRSESGVATAIVDKVADYFARLYAVTPSAATDVNAVLLQVNNASDFERYTAVVSYLEELPLIKNVDVVQVRGPLLQVRVQLNTRLDRFLDTLKLDRKLQAIAGDSGPGTLSFSLSQNSVSVADDETQKPLEFIWR